MTLANKYLGYSYFLTGTVFKGQQLGRTIGFTTASKIKERLQTNSKNGVYIVKSVINQRNYFGMMNIGFNQQSLEKIYP
jgi:riboflavin kinase/FMN adenylyltransferase